MHAPTAIPVVATTLHRSLANVLILLILQMLQFLHFISSSTKVVCRRIWEISQWQGQPKLQEVIETHSAACWSWKMSVNLYTLVQWKVSLQLQNAIHQLCVLYTTLNVGKPNWWYQSFCVKEHSLEAKPLLLKLKRDPTLRGGHSRTGCWERYLGLTADWRKLHCEELHDLYQSWNIIWAIKSKIWNRQGIWHTCKRKRNPHNVLVNKPDG